MATKVTKAGVDKAVKFWLQFLKDLNVGEKNISLYKEVFKKMTLEEIDIVCNRIESGEFLFPVYVKNMDKEVKGSFERVIQIAEEYGIPLFERLILTDGVTGTEYMTPEESLVLLMPSRRQVHHLLKKISAPENEKTIDHLSGQVTGDSKGAAITQPEFNALKDKGYEDALIELIKLRGGDTEAFKAMAEQLEGTGKVSMAPILEMGTTTRSVETFHNILLGMHLDNNADLNGN